MKHNENTGPRLLADIGGTNARFAWQSGPGATIDADETLACSDHDHLADALRRYLERLGRGMPRDASIAIATPVLGDRVAMTNHHWSFSISELKAAFGFERLRVLNDFTALALALPDLSADERRQVGGGAPQPGRAVALIGPGTGLGVSGLVPDVRGDWVALQGEGGHATQAGCTEREHAVLAEIARRHGHVSAERVLSGAGLENIHRALFALEAADVPAPAWSAAQITTAALHAGDARCAEALSLFCAFLGITAGNLALTLGAQGGVYIGGGIVPRLGPWFDRSPFRARFEGKGRFALLLASVPAFVIEARQPPALRGAARALDAGTHGGGAAG